MKTFFCRHSSKLDVDRDTLEFLWNNDYMAIHYPTTIDGWNEEADSESLNPMDYTTFAKRAINALHKIAKKGGYVFAVYGHKSDYKIGFIEPNTKIEIVEGTWGNKGKVQGRVAKLKALKFKSSKIIKRGDALSLTCAQPQQGTLCEWHKVKNRVENYYNGTEIAKKTVDDLTPDLLEVLCSEFLRTNLDEQLPRIQSLLTPVGRTMKDVDIIGITNNHKRILAQVTNLHLPQGKINKLLKYSGDDDSELILFCKTSKIQIQDNILIYDIREAFEKFIKTEIGSSWLKHVI